MTVTGTAVTGGSHQVLTWLPPQYNDSRFSSTRFPVLMVLPGQPSTPQVHVPQLRLPLGGDEGDP